MPNFSIRLVNSTFESHDNGADYERAEDALDVGIHSALRIIQEEIGGDRHAAAVDVYVEDKDRACVLRSVVALSVSSLLIRS